ncbi:MAG TPA: dihydrolipoamide acetyltransferase family protein [Thermoleophilaceae bacterium]|nr:dihydrolipoamide acetyltransferase family protein [Thermoleophilaceae bacterium]
MASDVTMPRLSDSMEEGTVLKWLVEEGGEVKRGEPLVEIETDKANMTYDADSDGVLVEIVAQEGDTLPIGEVIARIGEAGEAKSSGGEDEAEESGQEEADDGGEDEAEDSDKEEGAGEDEGAEEEAEEPAQAEADGDGEAEAEGEAAVAGAEGGGGETQAAAGTATSERPSGGNGDGRVKASPVARRMARDLGVELAELEGTGPGGRIVKADVQAAAENGGGAKAEAKAEPAEPAEEAAPAEKKEKPKKREEKKEAKAEPQRGEAGAKGEVEIKELTRLQQTVSRRMAESKATAPDFSIALTVDMTPAVELRERLKEISDSVPSFNDMVVKAAANALREFPRVNGAYRDGKFELYDKVNIGFAVAAQDALVVPTVFDADKKSLGQIARDAREVIEKVKEKTVTPPELSGGTFTVSNLGMFGIEQFTAIINPPQAAILTVGKLDKKPAVDDKGRVVARDQMTLTMVCDHRILYGADGAKFLARIKELLEQPLSLAL